MIGLAIGIALMGAIVTAQWPGGLGDAATDPRAFVNGLSVALQVNAVIALVAATLAAITIAGGRAASVRPGRFHWRGGSDGRERQRKAAATRVAPRAPDRSRPRTLAPRSLHPAPDRPASNRGEQQ